MFCDLVLVGVYNHVCQAALSYFSFSMVANLLISVK